MLGSLLRPEPLHAGGDASRHLFFQTIFFLRVPLNSLLDLDLYIFVSLKVSIKKNEEKTKKRKTDEKVSLADARLRFVIQKGYGLYNLKHGCISFSIVMEN